MNTAIESAPTVAESLPNGARRPIATTLLCGLVVLAAAATTLSYLRNRGRESTDDAQVETHVVSVATRIPGHVKRVLVQDNQAVHVGDVLLELDDSELFVRLTAAKADREAARAALATAEAQVAVTEAAARSNLKIARGGLDQATAVADTARAGISIAEADLAAATSKRTLAESELVRAQTLHEKGAISDAELDAHGSACEQARAAESLCRARLVSANASIVNSGGTLAAAHGHLLGAESGPEQIQAARAQAALASARVRQADANVAQAELALSYVAVRAESNGVVARRSVEPGQAVSPDRPLMAIVNLEDPWIVANFKEDQIGRMRTGQHARVRIDTYEGREFQAYVSSITPGTGARFSILPPDNASGNFTKVVQRVPVLLRFEPLPAIVLRPGMSSLVTVQLDD